MTDADTNKKYKTLHLNANNKRPKTNRLNHLRDIHKNLLQDLKTVRTEHGLRIARLDHGLNPIMAFIEAQKNTDDDDFATTYLEIFDEWTYGKVKLDQLITNKIDALISNHFQKAAKAIEDFDDQTMCREFQQSVFFLEDVQLEYKTFIDELTTKMKNM